MASNALGDHGHEEDAQPHQVVRKLAARRIGSSVCPRKSAVCREPWVPGESRASHERLKVGRSPRDLAQQPPGVPPEVIATLEHFSTPQTRLRYASPRKPFPPQIIDRELFHYLLQDRHFH